MPIFEVEAGGQKFQIDAPSIEAAASAFSAMGSQANPGAGSAPPATPVPLEGQLSPQPLQTAQTGTNDAPGMLKALGVGAVKGVTGLADIPHLIHSGLNAGNAALRARFPDYVQPRDTTPLSLPTSGDVNRSIEGVTGEFYKPQTRGEEYAQRIGEFGTGLIAPGGWARRLASVIGAGVGSKAGEDLAGGPGTVKGALGSVAGAVLGGMSPAALSRLHSPIPAVGAVGEERKRLARVLADAGVTDITAGQATGSRALLRNEARYGDAAFAGGKFQKAEQNQVEQLTRAVTKDAGFDGLATSSANKDNMDRLKAVYKTVDDNNVVSPQPALFQRMAGAVNAYESKVLPTQMAGGKSNLDKIVGDIADVMVQQGSMPGTMYRELRGTLEGHISSAYRGGDNALGAAIKEVREALDDAYLKSLTPENAALIAKTNRQYATQKLINEAVGGGDPRAAHGLITPSSLRREVESASSADNYATGVAPLSNLSRAATGVMVKPSFTAASPSSINTMLNMMGASAGAGRLIMSKPIQGWLKNQTFGKDPSMAHKALINLLLSGDLPTLSGGQR